TVGRTHSDRSMLATRQCLSLHFPSTCEPLLRARRERPRRRTAEQRDELATLHSITSSASASSVHGTVRPSALAILRLMTSSNDLGCSTGISAGFAPRRILSTKSAERRQMPGQFGP